MKLFRQTYGEGPPLIILHGLFGSSDNWHTLAGRFGHYFRVYAVDLRNHGRSPHSEIHTYKAMAEDLLELFNDKGINSAAIVGHSMGGKTAMQFALDHPRMIDRLVVVDIAPKSYPAHHDHLFDAMLSLDLARYSSRGEIAAALAAEIPSDTTRQFLLKNLKRNDDGSYSWKINLEALSRSYGEMNRAITGGPLELPALFMRGTLSDYILEQDIPDCKVLFPSSEVVDVKSGHWIHAEAPEEFYRIVLDFLGRAA